MIYSFINQKGGVGKTTSSVNMAAYLANAGKKVLLVDLDSQANASNALGTNTTTGTTYDVLTDRKDIVRDSLIHNTTVPNLTILPACRYLAGVDLELSAIKKDREFILKRKLGPIKNNYDYIIIDCPPALGTITVNALTASDAIIIPMQCEYLSMLGLSQLMYTVRQTQKYLNPSLHIEGIILTMYDKRSKLTHSVRAEIEDYFKGKVYNTTIPRNVRLAEAPSYGLPILKYEATCSGAVAYRALAEEFMAREAENARAKSVQDTTTESNTTKLAHQAPTKKGKKTLAS